MASVSVGVYVHCFPFSAVTTPSNPWSQFGFSRNGGNQPPQRCNVCHCVESIGLPTASQASFRHVYIYIYIYIMYKIITINFSRDSQTVSCQSPTWYLWGGIFRSETDKKIFTGLSFFKHGYLQWRNLNRPSRRLGGLTWPSLWSNLRNQKSNQNLFESIPQID